MSLFPPTESQEQLDFKDTELQMLVVSLKELTATKEVIQTLEQLLCDDASQLEEERVQVHFANVCLYHCTQLMQMYHYLQYFTSVTIRG